MNSYPVTVRSPTGAALTLLLVRDEQNRAELRLLVEDDWYSCVVPHELLMKLVGIIHTMTVPAPTST